MPRKSYGIPGYYKTYPDALVRRFANNHSRGIDDIFAISDFAQFCASASRYRRSVYHTSSHELKRRGQYAVVTTLFTFLERQSKASAKIMSQLNSNIVINISDLKGDLLDRLKVFWIKIYRVRFRKGYLWKRLKNLQAIRNCIVHCDGYADESRDASLLKRLAVRTKGFSLSDGQITLTFAFCDRAKKYVLEFCDEITDAIHPKIISRIQKRTKRTNTKKKSLTPR
jgi:hypothetical protein